MTDSVPKVSKSVAHYVSHRLRANAQFYEIDTIMQSMRTEPYIIYMVPDYNKNAIHMSFCEGQVD